MKNYFRRRIVVATSSKRDEVAFKTAVYRLRCIPSPYPSAISLNPLERHIFSFLFQNTQTIILHTTPSYKIRSTTHRKMRVKINENLSKNSPVRRAQGRIIVFLALINVEVRVDVFSRTRFRYILFETRSKN